MGDIIEITTRADQPVPFYRICTSGVSFELKVYNSGLVGLNKHPDDTCQYWCGFKTGGRVWVKGPEGIKVVNTGNFDLNQYEYQKFWIAWDCGVVRIGKDEEVSAMLSYPKDGSEFNFVTFTSDDAMYPPTWKLHLPPASLFMVRNSEPYKQIKGGELRWERAKDQLPDDAVIGGFEAETVYIIRGTHRGSLTPGKFVPSEREAYIPWGGAAIVLSDFEILCGYNYTWVLTNDDNIPINAFVANEAEGSQEKLYIGRAKHMNFIVPGNVQPSHKCCYIPFGGNEYPFHTYEILTIPELDPYSAGGQSHANLDPGIVAHEIPGLILNNGMPIRHQINFDDEDD